MIEDIVDAAIIVESRSRGPITLAEDAPRCRKMIPEAIQTGQAIQSLARRSLVFTIRSGFCAQPAPVVIANTRIPVVSFIASPTF